MTPPECHASSAMPEVWFQLVMDAQHLNVWCKKVIMAECCLQVVVGTSHRSAHLNVGYKW